MSTQKKKRQEKSTKRRRGRPEGTGFFQFAKKPISPGVFRAMDDFELRLRARFGHAVSKESLRIFHLMQSAAAADEEAARRADSEALDRVIASLNANSSELSDSQMQEREAKLRADWREGARLGRERGLGVRAEIGEALMHAFAQQNHDVFSDLSMVIQGHNENPPEIRWFIYAVERMHIFAAMGNDEETVIERLPKQLPFTAEEIWKYMKLWSKDFGAPEFSFGRDVARARAWIMKAAVNLDIEIKLDPKGRGRPRKQR